MLCLTSFLSVDVVLNQAFLLVSMKEMICRLCSQTIVDTNYQLVEKSLLKSLKLNINIGTENVMCIECANCLRVFSNITPSCGDGMLPLFDLGIGVKLESEAIETKTNLNSFMETEMKCSFCTQTHGREDLISLKESKENKFLVNMLERYILETNLKNNEDLLTCETCLVALQDGLTVILKCLEVERKISEYIEMEVTDDKGQVKLKEVQQFMFGPIIKSEIESFGVNELEDRSNQTQEEYTTMAEAEIKYEKDIRNAELIIKAEDDDITSEQSDCDIPDIKSEQSDYDGYLGDVVSPQPVTTKFCGKQECSEAKGGPLKTSRKHKLADNVSEARKYQCDSCTFRTKCVESLKRNRRLHKSPKEIKMYHCNSCHFKTKHRRSLDGHRLIHRDASEIEMYQCGSCNFKTKYKCNLTHHRLIHKDASEIELYQCDSCHFKTKRKQNLKEHVLIHKDSSKITMHQCGFCSFQTKYKRSLHSHKVTHMLSTETMIYQCKSCSFNTKHKRCLSRHMKTHKPPLRNNVPVQF